MKRVPTDKQGILSEAEEGKLDNDRHMYTIKKKQEPVKLRIHCPSCVWLLPA